jgi:anaerobic selenocysteine-containing dehydrogenase
MTDTARHADVVLPATTFLEHDELVLSYGTGLLQRSRPAIPAVGEARPNHVVFAELCRRLGLSRADDPETADGLVDALLSDEGASVRQTLDRDGVVTPACGLTPLPMVDVMPATPDGRIRLVPVELDAEAPGGLYFWQDDPADEQHPLSLISPAQARTITSTMGQLDPRPAQLRLCGHDADSRGIGDGDLVRVFNALGEVRCSARLDEDLRPGVVMLPKGLWSQHTLNGRTANALVPDGLTDLGGGACFNDARVEVERVCS